MKSKTEMILSGIFGFFILTFGLSTIYFLGYDFGWHKDTFLVSILYIPLGAVISWMGIYIMLDSIKDWLTRNSYIKYH